MVPDRDTRVVVVALEDLVEFHFDRITRAVTNRAFGGHCDDGVLVHLRSTLLNGSDDVLSNVSREPLVNS